MKVSVIIATHNRPLQLQQAYQSVLNQTRRPDEVIIIDDGSDKSVKPLLENLSCQSVKISLERSEVAQGASRSRNRGAEIAFGDVLMFLDDDDTWEPNKISEQLTVFTQNPDVGLVYSGRLVVSDTNREKLLYIIQPNAFGNLYPQILYKNLIGTTSSVAIKRNLFINVGGFDETMPSIEDHEFWIRVCQKIRVGHDNSCNVRYTVAEKANKQISGQAERHIEAVCKILDKYSKEIAAQGWLNSRRIRASMLFYVAKSLSKRDLNQVLPWIIRSFIQYPSFKILVLILPTQTRQWLRKLIK